MATASPRREQHMSLWKALRQDLGRDGCTRLTLLPRLLFAPRTQAVVLVRIAQAAGPFGPIVKWINHVLTGCDVAADARIGPGLHLPHPAGVVIGPGTTIGANCTIAQHATLGAQSGEPTLEDDVRIGAGAVVLGPVRLGRGARVAANSVVMIDVPAGRLAVGIPATIK